MLIVSDAILNVSDDKDNSWTNECIKQYSDVFDIILRVSYVTLKVSDAILNVSDVKLNVSCVIMNISDIILNVSDVILNVLML